MFRASGEMNIIRFDELYLDRVRQVENYSYRERAFRDVCSEGNMAYVRGILEIGITKSSCEYGFVCAAKAGQLLVVDYLLSRGWVEPSCVEHRALEYLAGNPLPNVRSLAAFILRDERVNKQLIRNKRHPNLTRMLGESRLRMLPLLGPSFHKASGGLPTEAIINIIGFMEPSWREGEVRQFIKQLRVRVPGLERVAS
jgi:hypothetical protein